MKAVVLAGGKGTRLAPYTRIIPKPMLPVGDRAILEILLLQMKRAGIQEVILTVGHLSGLMKAYFQDGQHLGLRICYSYENCPLGTAGPLAMVEGLEDTFLVTNGDVLTTLDLQDLLKFHARTGGIATIATHRRKVFIDLGVIHVNGGHEIVDYIEKPTLEYQVSMGIYVFEPRVLRYIPKGEYLDFPDLVKTLLAVGEKVVAYPFDGYWKDLGRPDDYEQANLDFEQIRNQLLPEETSWNGECL
ncbi:MULTISPECIES: sugar phosphate nucleotidyltransferase [Anaerolinea]|uniref:sugar phosphate nucleotidyltransferase n=1 Tax=Anaerolinea TaxID=233189 RepID=UPI0026396DEB|nr:sugar phosphate nucleotidyltransferase [Anaerolinea thermophila]